MTFTACVSQEIIFFLLQMSSKQLNKMPMMTHIFKSLDCDCDSWLSWLSDDLSPPGVITCWELDLIYWIKNIFFPIPEHSSPKKLLTLSCRHPFPAPPQLSPVTLKVRGADERSTCEGWWVGGGRGGERRTEKGGGELILEPRNDWLVVSEWQGTGPLPGASVPHTQPNVSTFIHGAIFKSPSPPRQFI